MGLEFYLTLAKCNKYMAIMCVLTYSKHYEYEPDLCCNVFPDIMVTGDSGSITVVVIFSIRESSNMEFSNATVCHFGPGNRLQM